MRSSIAIVLAVGLFGSSCDLDDIVDDTTGQGGTRNASGGARSGGTGAGASDPGGTGGARTAFEGPSGCSADAQSGVHNRTIEVGGAERGYVLSVPENYDAARHYPLVFAWHGSGGDGALARLYFGVEEQAAGAAIFVYPDGILIADGEAAWNLAPDGGDVELFDALLASLWGEYCVDATRIFATGHSYGGYMTNRLGCSRGDVLRAVAPVAGGPPFGAGRNAACTGHVAAMVIHGTNDPVVEVSEGVAARDHFRVADGCSSTSHASAPAPCVSYDCSRGLPVSWCEHDAPEADAHDWPSFAAEGIWQFFAQ